MSEQQLAEMDRLRDRIAELETFAYGCDAEGCVIPHSSWCEAAKKTASENDGCTCGKPWKGHPQPHAMYCWAVNPPRSEVEEMRKRIAELLAERHSTNEALSDAAEAIRANESRWSAVENVIERAYRKGYDPDAAELAELLGTTEAWDAR